MPAVEKLDSVSKSLPAKIVGAVASTFVLVAALVLVALIVSIQQIAIRCDDLFRTLVKKAKSPRGKRDGTLPDASNRTDWVRHPCIAQSATTIAAKIRSGEYTSEEVVNAFIEQAESVNVCMNVICDRRYDAARAEAKAVDAEMKLRRITNKSLDDLPPFYGVPCSIKEFFAMAGMLQTGGVMTRKTFRPEEDATPVKRLRAAGFIILMNTNTSELGMWYASDNPVWGRSNNAYDHRRIVGGSSGGEAALISAGGVPTGIGSDIGGSIRIPAGFNGVFGHKPTGGLIPNSGQYPTTNQRFMTTGPICRYSADLLPMLEVLRGPDNIDSSCVAMKLVDVKLPLHTAVVESALPAVTTVRANADEPQKSPESTPSTLARLMLGGTDEDQHRPSPKLHVVDRTQLGQKATHRQRRSSSISSLKDTAEILEQEHMAQETVPGGGGGDEVARTRVSSEHLGSPAMLPDDLAAFRHITRPPITDWSSVTVWMVRDLHKVKPRLSSRIERAVDKAMYTAADTLIDVYGCRGIRYLDLPELQSAFDMWTAVLGAAEQPTFRELLAEGYGGTLDIGWQLLLWCFGKSDSTLPALILALIEDIPAKIMPSRQKKLIAECQAAKLRIYDILAKTNGVLLIPMHPTTAPLHDVPLLRFFNVAYTQLFNVLENPITVVPIGLDEKGMPVSVQVVGAHGFDKLCIAVGQALEHAGTAGWIPPQNVTDCPKCLSAQSLK